ncbi:MAG: thymidylate kinase [Candidatus Methanogranum gryphiswaldense]|nr:MAG: thymidylate kinase [Candidatus Methanogranum sp. U3.2.1]
MTWYVIDGMDGSGKTTTACLLKDILESKDHTVKIITHPEEEHIFGKLSRKCLLKEGGPAKLFTIVFFILNVSGSLIRIKKSRTDDVIFVRYTLSACYLPEKLVPFTYKALTAVLPKPDVLIYKDVDEEIALGRIRKRGNNLEMFENIESLTETRKKMIMVSKDWYIINAKDTPDEVADRLQTIIPK